MADTATRRMTVEEFLQWEDGTDTRYELIDGVPVAMAQGRVHAALASRLDQRIGHCLAARKPARAFVNMKLRSPWSRLHCYRPDVAVTLEPVAGNARRLAKPFLVVDLTQAATDDRSNFIHYFRMVGLQEFALLETRCIFAEVYRRRDENSWFSELGNQREWRLKLESIGLDVSLGDLYQGLPVEEPVYPDRSIAS